MNNPMDDVFPALGVNDLSGDPTVPPYIPIHAEVETNRQTRDGSLIESTSLLPSRSASSLSKTARPKTQKGDNKSCEVNYNQCSYHHCTFMLSASGDHGTDTSGTQKKIGGLSPCIPEERTQDIAAEGGNSPREIDVREQRFESQLQEERHRNYELTAENDQLKEILELSRGKLEATEIELQECKMKLAHESGKTGVLESMVNIMTERDGREVSSKQNHDFSEMMKYKALAEELQKKLIMAECECAHLQEKMVHFDSLRERKLLSEKMKDLAKSIENLEAQIYEIDDVDVVQRDSGMYSPEESLMVPPITTNLSQDTQELITAIGVNGHAEYFGHQTTRTASPASIYYEHSNQHRDEQSSVKPKKSLRNFFSAILRRKKMKRAALQAMLEGGNNVGSVPRSMNEYAIVEEDAVST